MLAKDFQALTGQLINKLRKWYKVMYSFKNAHPAALLTINTGKEFSRLTYLYSLAFTLPTTSVFPINGILG